MASPSKKRGAPPASKAGAPQAVPGAEELREAAEAAVAEARARADAAEARAEEYLDAARRVKAEFENFRKRTEREREQAQRESGERIVRELLPVLDGFERALDALADVPAATREGLLLVGRSLADVLAREGLSAIAPQGERFDPHEHEALAAIPADAEEGMVIEVVQRGFRLGDRVLRPARVIVAAAPEEASTP